jgi:polyhydroxyalkanoate synthesis regulator phasin
MVGIDSYMNTYLDRRMKYLIQDYDLATRQDLGTFESRLQAVEEATGEIDIFEAEAEEKLGALEARLKNLKEAKK